jgi:hypothetical protein
MFPLDCWYPLTLAVTNIGVGVALYLVGLVVLSTVLCLSAVLVVAALTSESLLDTSDRGDQSPLSA